jgi:hypothetical protein
VSIVLSIMFHVLSVFTLGEKNILYSLLFEALLYSSGEYSVSQTLAVHEERKKPTENKSVSVPN